MMRWKHMLLTGTMMTMIAATSVSSVFAAESSTESVKETQAETEAKEAQAATEAREEQGTQKEQDGKGGLLGALSDGVGALSGGLDSLSDTLDSWSGKLESLPEGKEALDGLFGKGGILEGVLPEGTDLDGLIGSVKERIADADGKVANALEDVREKVENTAGSIDLDTVNGYVGSLLGQVVGAGAGSETESDLDFLDELFRKTESIRAAQNAYMLDKNAESMDPGDVQIVTNTCIWEDADLDKEEIKVLAKIDQNNYTQNDKNELDFLSGAGDVVLFTLHAEDDGSYSVTDARFAEDGEGYLSSIEAFCDEVGTPLEDCMQTIDFADVMVLYDLEEYLNQHPDIKGIEYAGEVVDLEGLKTAQDNLLDLLLSEEDAEM